MVFQKDLRPLTKRGQVIKQRGKGATEQRVPRGMMDSVSGPATIGRALNNYAKPAPAPPTPGPDVGPMPPPGPMPPEQ